MRESIYGGSITGPVSAGFAPHMPSIGFAAAQKEGLRQAEAGEEHKPLTKKATSSNGSSADKEHGRKEHIQTSPKLIAIAAGRRIHLAKKGNDWRPFQDRLGAVNPLFREIPATKLMLKYLTDTEMTDLVAARFPASRPITQSKAITELREVMSKLNTFSEQEQARDLARERKILSASPDLARIAMERMLDPDNPKWFSSEPLASNPVSREQISAWLPADFYVPDDAEIFGTNKVGIVLEDTSGVLLRGRNHFIDAMGDKKYGGFDVSGVSTEWKPEVELMHSIGGRNIEGVEFRVPSMPLIMPLKEPHVYEI